MPSSNHILVCVWNITISNVTCDKWWIPRYSRYVLNIFKSISLLPLLLCRLQQFDIYYLCDIDSRETSNGNVYQSKKRWGGMKNTKQEPSSFKFDKIYVCVTHNLQLSQSQVKSKYLYCHTRKIHTHICFLSLLQIWLPFSSANANKLK